MGPPRPPPPTKASPASSLKPNRKAPIMPKNSEATIKSTRKAPTRPETSQNSPKIKKSPPLRPKTPPKSPVRSAKFRPNSVNSEKISPNPTTKSIKKIAPSIPLPPPREDDSNIDIKLTKNRLRELDTRMELISTKLESLQPELEKEVPDALSKKRFDEYVEMQQEMMIEKNTLMLKKELYELTQM